MFHVGRSADSDMHRLVGCRCRCIREGTAQPVRVMDSILQYNHQCGTLHLPFSNPGCSPVALAEIAAAGRRFPALTQVRALLLGHCCALLLH